MSPTPRAPSRRALAVASAGATLALVTSGFDGAAAAPAPAALPAVAQVSSQVAPEVLLALGDAGPTVAAWQRQLNVAAARGLTVDAIFGTPTELATLDFHRLFGLPATGHVDARTRDVMRLVIAERREHTTLTNLMAFEAAGYPHGMSYCVALLAHPPRAWSVECTIPTRQPIDVQVAAFDHPSGFGSVAFGTVDPVIDRVELDLASGGSVTADLTREAAGVDRSIWISPAPAQDVAVVRALAVDGSEVRRIVLEGDDPFLVLELGDRGPAVRQWQRELNAVTGAGLIEDGVLGSNTARATANFQRFFGLPDDGVVGPETRRLMEQLLTDPGAPLQPVGETLAGDFTTEGFPGDLPAALLQDARLSGHGGVDRLVFEFGSEMPEVRFRMIDSPIRARPSGLPVEVEGTAFLEVVMSRSGTADLSGGEPVITYPGPDRLVSDTGVVTEVVKVEDFEHRLGWVIGLDADAAYGFETFTDPHRLVIDVRIPK